MSVRNVLYHHHYYLSFNQQNLPFLVITVDIHHFHLFTFLNWQNFVFLPSWKLNEKRQISIEYNTLYQRLYRCHHYSSNIIFPSPSFLIDMCQAVVYVYSHENSKHDHHLSHIQICSSLFPFFSLLSVEKRKQKKRFHTFDR